MDDKDFELLENLFTRLSDDVGRKLEEQGEAFDRKLEKLSESFGRKLEEQGEVFGRKLEEQSEVFSRKLEEQGEVFSRKLDEQGEAFSRKLDEQSDNFQRWLGVQGDDFQHKLNLVVEGQQLLVERIDRLEVELKEEIRKVDQRVTILASDLSAHRKDTEAHGTVYRVKED